MLLWSRSSRVSRRTIILIRRIAGSRAMIVIVDCRRLLRLRRLLTLRRLRTLRTLLSLLLALATASHKIESTVSG